MATGRIGVTPTLRTRWSKAPSAGTTSLSGLDDNSVSLVYDVGYEAVYRNGVLLSRGNDYTATNGTTVTLIDATIAGDIIEILANQLVPLTDAISKGQFTAKGALLSATAASTPGVLTVGSNDQVLTADSSTATGLKWATPSSGGWTSLATGSLSGTTTTVNITTTGYKQVQVFLKNVTAAADYNMDVRLNGDSGNNYNFVGATMSATTTFVSQARSATDNFFVDAYEAGANGYFSFTINDPANTDAHKIFAGIYTAKNSANTFNLAGFVNGRYMSNSAISSISFVMGATASTGTYEIYGVK